MNFRIKCIMQTIFGMLPNSEQMNYIAQKYISRNLPPSRQMYHSKFIQAMEHHKSFVAHKSVDNAIVYEIECGWHLAMALVFCTLGYNRIKALDVNDHIRSELVNTIVRYLREDGKISVSTIDIKKNKMKGMLEDEFRIDLLIPGDSTQTGMDDQSVDFIYSQEVFEHIEPVLLTPIMNECHRVLKDDGLISFYINYADHYCSIDKKITPYNFLRYDDKKWKKYNPCLHYVNRLRHKDFLKIFQEAGFKVVEETVYRPNGWEQMLKKFPLSEKFSDIYTLDEISITSARIILQKRL